MNQVEELLKVVEEAQADQGNVVIVTGKPGSGKSKVLREAAEAKKWHLCRLPHVDQRGVPGNSGC